MGGVHDSKDLGCLNDLKAPLVRPVSNTEEDFQSHSSLNVDPLQNELGLRTLHQPDGGESTIE